LERECILCIVRIFLIFQNERLMVLQGGSIATPSLGQVDSGRPAVSAEICKIHGHPWRYQGQESTSSPCFEAQGLCGTCRVFVLCYCTALSVLIFWSTRRFVFQEVSLDAPSRRKTRLVSSSLCQENKKRLATSPCSGRNRTRALDLKHMEFAVLWVNFLFTIISG